MDACTLKKISEDADYIKLKQEMRKYAFDGRDAYTTSCFTEDMIEKLLNDGFDVVKIIDLRGDIRQIDVSWKDAEENKRGSLSNKKYTLYDQRSDECYEYRSSLSFKEIESFLSRGYDVEAAYGDEEYYLIAWQKRKNRARGKLKEMYSPRSFTPAYCGPQ